MIHMPQISNEELIEKAKFVRNPIKIRPGCTVGDVGYALITDRGNVYRGVSADTSCGVGFCAAHSAIAAMSTARAYSCFKLKEIATLRN